MYWLVSAEQQRAVRQQLGLPVDGRVLLIAGGSNGAEKINRAIAAIAGQLLDAYTDLTIVHQLGRRQQAVYDGRPASKRLITAEFFAPDDMARFSAAADVIVTRAGATTIAEFAAQAKACIVVPNPLLTGGHQVKNAQALAEQGAIIHFPEAQLSQHEKLLAEIRRLLDEPKERQELAHRLASLARPKAAADIAQLLLQVAAGQGRV